MSVDFYLINQIDAILPQTQCTQCGYQGCMPYATAIAEGVADINQCPPGGDAGVRALASLLKIDYKPINPAFGVTKPKAVAIIDEATCIGCTLCIQACPVDAILGASKQMHTIITTECTGCELCLAPCPVDCIIMLPFADSKVDTKEYANLARERYNTRLARIERETTEQAQKHAKRMQANNTELPVIKKTIHTAPQMTKQAAIAAAIALVKAEKLAVTDHSHSHKTVKI